MKKTLPILLASLVANVALAEKSKVIILTGANNHGWEATTPVLKRAMEESGCFEVEVVTDPEQLTADFLKDRDVLLSNWNAFGKPSPAPWSEALKKAYVEFVREGGGHVVVHAGSSSFYDWDDYHAICCATWKGKTGHVAPHEFEVRLSIPDHPIVKDLERFNISDELWFRPLVHSNAIIIAESYSKTTGNWEPTALVGEFGKGRCFCLLLGHDGRFMKQEKFKTLLINGTKWTAQAR